MPKLHEYQGKKLLRDEGIPVPRGDIASTPEDEPVTRGFYGISRHPIYLSGFLMFIGTGVACASWVVILCGLLWIIIWNGITPTEERHLSEKYGDSYREYMNRTPRWIGF